jgi:hypothetical protein
MRLQHNPHLGLYAVAEKLKEELDKSKQYYAIDELENIKVAVVKEDLSKELERLINSNKQGLPIVLIARGTNISTDVMRPMGGKNELTLFNGSDVLHFKGEFFNYESEIQVIVVTRTQVASIELQLELKRLLNTVLRKVYYKLQIIRDNEEELWYCDNYGFLALDNFGGQFDTQKEQDVYVTYITGISREQYFKYDEAPIVKSFEVKGKW